MSGWMITPPVLSEGCAAAISCPHCITCWTNSRPAIVLNSVSARTPEALRLWAPYIRTLGTVVKKVVPCPDEFESIVVGCALRPTGLLLLFHVMYACTLDSYLANVPCKPSRRPIDNMVVDWSVTAVYGTHHMLAYCLFHTQHLLHIHTLNTNKMAARESSLPAHSL